MRDPDRIPPNKKPQRLRVGHCGSSCAARRSGSGTLNLPGGVGSRGKGGLQFMAILRGLAASWMWSLTVSIPSASRASILSLSMVSSNVKTFR